MWFGLLDIDEALGAVLAHRMVLASGVIKKGTVLGEEHLAALRQGGIRQVMVARLGADDCDENSAASRIARTSAGQNLTCEQAFTGRVNLMAAVDGVVTVDRAGIDALNALDDAITIATLPDFSVLRAGEMVATIKIIPYGVGEKAVEAAEALGPLLHVAPLKLRHISYIATVTDSLGEKVLAKTRAVTAARLAALGAGIMEEIRVRHEVQAIAAALTAAKGELILMFGASAIADRNDVLPQALVMAGGRIERFGMPVDPGNLLLLGDLHGRPVLGAPGCARSPKANGFDDVLARLIAGLTVTARDIGGMGVGGLLTEIATRPQPRLGAEKPRIAALVLAAGRSTRMQGPNKLLTAFGGEALVRRVVRQALAVEGLAEVVVVTGHQQAEIMDALAALPVRFVHNAAFADGLSTSLQTGLTAIEGRGLDGVLVLLGDMPLVSPETVQSLMAAFAPGQGREIIIPTVRGQRGNPVLWGSRHFDALKAVSGDKGGRELIAAKADTVYEVAIDHDGPLVDLDTPEAFETHAPDG